MAEDVRVYEISTSGVANLNNNEICNETTSDADLSYRMWGGKDNSGDTTKWLAKDKNAQVVDLNVTGDITVVGGSIACDALSLSTAADYQIMYGDFQQASTLFWKGSKLKIGATGDPFFVVDIESTSQDHLRLENSNTDANGAFFVMDKNSASPADNDVVADIRLRGRDSGAAATDYGRIRATSLDVTAGTEDGSVIISAIANASEVDAMVFGGDKIYTALSMAVGKTTLEAWPGTMTALQIGGNDSIFSITAEAAGSAFRLANNIYYDGAFKRYSTDECEMIEMKDGVISFYADASDTAGVGFTRTEIMQLDYNAFAKFPQDGSAFVFGSGANISLQHITDTGLRINSGYSLSFRDSAIYINSANDGYLDYSADTGHRFNNNIAISKTSSLSLSLIKTDDTAEGVYQYFTHTRANPADDDILSDIVFNGNDDGDNSNTYGRIRARASDVSNGAESGSIELSVDANGASQASILKVEGDAAQLQLANLDIRGTGSTLSIGADGANVLTFSGSDCYTVAWTDYSGTATITGWAATPTVTYYYKKIGKLVYVKFSITGTSSTTAATFTLPSAADGGTYFTCRGMDAGTDIAGGACGGIGIINSSTVNLQPDQNFTEGTTSWTGSGTKAVSGQFFYHEA